MAKKSAKPRSSKPRDKVKTSQAKGNSKVDPNQKQLPGAEEDRIAAIERVVKQLVDKKAQRADLKTDIDDLLDKLPPLFKKHDLRQYSCYGKTVVIEPGADVVRIKKAKSQ